MYVVQRPQSYQRIPLRSHVWLARISSQFFCVLAFLRLCFGANMSKNISLGLGFGRIFVVTTQACNQDFSCFQMVVVEEEEEDDGEGEEGEGEGDDDEGGDEGDDA